MQDYQIESKKICDIIDEDTHVILPAIQRKFVWKEEQICNLFESIMEGFPIGTFLTWKVSGKKINTENSIGFYNFIKNYSEYGDKKYNELIKNPSNDKAYLAILDGQQRIQSLILGLKGSYATHLPNKKYDKIESYPRRYLYINLKKSFLQDEGKSFYTFKFLEPSIAANDEKNNWFEVGKIIGLLDEKDRRKYIREHYNFQTEDDNDEALSILSELNSCINDRSLLGCYAINKDRSLDDILDIFVRINSGGTKLSKPDLLFSTIITKWSDSRENFDDFLKNININEKQAKIFNFDIDFLIRTILYVFNISVILNIKNFNALDIDELKQNWDKIKNSITKTRNLLMEFGFTGWNITSYNAIMPIIYYVYNNGNIKDENVKLEIKKYFIIAQLKNLFGVASNSALTETRKALFNQKNFSTDLLKNISLVGNRNYSVSRDDIDTWLNTYKKGSPYVFMILSIIDPNFDNSKLIDIDHLYAESILRNNSCFKPYKDMIANLNLLQAKENRKSKSDMLLEDYIDELEKKEIIPSNIIKFLPEIDEKLSNYSLDNFKVFYDKRKKLIGDKLENILTGKSFGN